MAGRRRTRVRATLALLLVFVLLGAGVLWLRSRQAEARSREDSSSGPPPPAAGSPWPRSALPATAVAALATIEVGRQDAATGYSRQLFGADWLDPDGNGCDARNDVLRRDLTAVRLRPGGCYVDSGVLIDPYNGQRHAFRRGPQTSGEVQIDHVVSLSDAWRSGSRRWTLQQRITFANDPLELVASLKATNSAKDNEDASRWLPPTPRLRCAFVARQVAVKATYRLRMTAREHDAIAAVLATCPGQLLPGRDKPATPASR